MTDDDLAEMVTHDVVGNYGEEPETPNRGCLWLLFVTLLLGLLYVLI